MGLRDVAPIGVFTDIGTLARALQHAIDKIWDIYVLMIGSEMHILTDKHTAALRHELICTCVDLDQVNSGRHCDGWKLERI